MSYSYYLCLSTLLFAIGVAGVLLRKNLIIIFMSIELILNSVNLALVAISKFTHNPDGQIFVFFIITVAAAEAAVGLAIVIALYRHKQTMNVDELNRLKG